MTDRRVKTHCKRGHDLSIHGRPHGRGGRQCAECNKIRNRVGYVPDEKPEPADFEDLVRRYQSGQTVRSIAAECKVSSATVYRAVKAQGVLLRSKRITNQSIESVWNELMAEQEGENDGQAS